MFWSTKKMRARLTAVVVLAGTFVATPLMAETPSNAKWTQWGGPSRNFMVPGSGLADTWPAEGPKRLWHRALGSGYSGIVVDDGVLFTMYRTSKSNRYEYTIALDATTGETLWKKRCLATVPNDTKDYGKEFSGPNATPLVVGDRLYTVGRNANLHCFQKTGGKILWKHALRNKFGAQTQTCGYSSSPIAYNDTIIMPIGKGKKQKKEGQSLVAFNQEDGTVVWKSHTFEIEHSSPILINFGGEEKLIQCTKREIIAVNPETGDLLWKFEYPQPERFAGIFTTPVWNGTDTLYIASREVGCAVKLSKTDAGTTAEQLWINNKTPLGMATPILTGGVLYGAKRANQPLFMAVELATGTRLWVERLFPMATTLEADGKLIILDQEGLLALATVTREEMSILSRVQLTEKWSFTAPTLIGKTLYVRDEKHIMALDLG